MENRKANMVDIKEGGLENPTQEKPKPKETRPVESQFREKREAMRNRAAGIQKGFNEITASAPGNVDLTEEKAELAGLELRLTHASDRMQSELDERNNDTIDQIKKELELTETVSKYVKKLVDSSDEIGKTRVGENKPVTKKTEYLRRPGEKDANAIQVQIALGKKGGEVMRIENYALGTDARGHIAELKTLIIGEDGIAHVLHADRYGTHGGRKGNWSSQTTEADAADIQEAYDAMRRLRKPQAEEGTEQLEETVDPTRENADQAKSKVDHPRERSDRAREEENARIRQEIFGVDRVRDSKENPATDEDRAELLTAIKDMANNTEGSNTSRNVRPNVGETVRYLDRYDAQGNLLPWQDGLIVVSHQEHIQGHRDTYEAVIKNVETNATKENEFTARESIAIERDGGILVIRETIGKNDRGESERWLTSLPASRADVQKALGIMNTLYNEEQSRLEAARVAVEDLHIDETILPDLTAQNIELLRNAGEVGELLIPYYEYALRLAPGLATIRINRNDEAAPHANRSFKDGLHKVEIPMGVASPEILRDRLTGTDTLAHIAELLDMQPDELKQRPDLLYIYTALHELGHTVQYKEYDSDPEAFDQQRQKVIAELPIPGWNGIGLLEDTLADENSELSFSVRDHWGELQQRYGIQEPYGEQGVKELINIQSKAKHNMFHERFAHTFAVKVIKGLEAERAREKELGAV